MATEIHLPAGATHLKPRLTLLDATMLVMGGIIGGVFTPTESAVVAAFYAMVLGVLYRELPLRELPHVFGKVMVNSSVVLFITAVFAVGGWIVAFEKLPQTLTGLFGPIANNPVMVLLLINVIFLVLGCFMDALPLLIVVVPMFLPLVRGAGIDLISCPPAGPSGRPVPVLFPGPGGRASIRTRFRIRPVHLRPNT